MKNYINLFLEEISENFLRTHNQALMNLELPQTDPANHRAVDYMYELLTQNGVDAERLNFLADGKTFYHDDVMPLCWDASYGRLTVMSDWEGNRVIADYHTEPFSLIRYSVTTPAEGITARLVKWNDMLAGKDVKGAFVLIPFGMFPTEEALVPILDAGAIGLVNGTVKKDDNFMDCVHWANNLTETGSWNVLEGERDFIGFCVTPRIHQALERACEKGEVIVKAESDGHKYAGKMPAVTAVLPGKSKREFWVYAHTSEPLEDDNNAGVISSIAAIIAIKKAIDQNKLPPLKYTLRVLLSFERYGTVAFAHHYGDVLHDRCIGAVCMDGLPVAKEEERMTLFFANHAVPFYGNAIFQGVWDEYAKTIKEAPFITAFGDYFGGDTFLSDTSVGLPTVTILPYGKISWHNSSQRYNFVDYPRFQRFSAVMAAFMAQVTICDSQILTQFLPKAASYSIARLAETACTVPQRRGTDAHARLLHVKNIELRNIRDFSKAGVEGEAIENCCSMIEAFSQRLTEIPAPVQTEPTPVFDSFDQIIPKRLTVGIPHDLARVPYERRKHTLQTFLISRVFSSMDGHRTLKDLIIEAEWDQKTLWSEKELAYFLTTLELLCEFGYIELHKQIR